MEPGLRESSTFLPIIQRCLFSLPSNWLYSAEYRRFSLFLLCDFSRLSAALSLSPRLPSIWRSLPCRRIFVSDTTNGTVGTSTTVPQ